MPEETIDTGNLVLRYCKGCGQLDVLDGNEPVPEPTPDQVFRAYMSDMRVYYVCESCRDNKATPVFDERLLQLHRAVLSRIGSVEETQYEPLINAIAFACAVMLRVSQ